MNIKINPSTKIYVAVAAHAATGGPELLHQLVYNLRKIHYDAYMYYIPNDYSEPVHPAYKAYENPFVRKIEDAENNLIIVPEIYGTIKIFDKLKKIQKIIWWLSLDNFFISRSLERYPDKILINAIRIFNKILGYPKFDLPQLVMRLNKQFKMKEDKYLVKTKVHLVQSFYAKEILIKIGIPRNQIYYLSDYLNDDFLNTHIDYTKKEDIIIYNPAKGYSFTKKIINKLPQYKFVPIKNMTREEVKEVLLRAKVYIDFGNHPGKDRMPREAALSGCCVITGLRGSANNNFDVNILDTYKFEDKKSNIPNITNRIKQSIHYYMVMVKDFEQYRNEILFEKRDFIQNLSDFFQPKP